MDRSGDILTFSQAEQAEFNVEQILSPRSAVDVANVYFKTGIQILSRGTDNPIDLETIGSQAAANDRSHTEARALALLRFSNGILNLCPEIVVEDILRSVNQTKL